MLRVEGVGRLGGIGVCVRGGRRRRVGAAVRWAGGGGVAVGILVEGGGARVLPGRGDMWLRRSGIGFRSRHRLSRDPRRLVGARVEVEDSAVWRLDGSPVTGACARLLVSHFFAVPGAGPPLVGD
jgi:hypothetical protein